MIGCEGITAKAFAAHLFWALLLDPQDPAGGPGKNKGCKNPHKEEHEHA
jgi:hypothetical protein